MKLSRVRTKGRLHVRRELWVRHQALKQCGFHKAGGVRPAVPCRFKFALSERTQDGGLRAEDHGDSGASVGEH